MSRRRVVEPGAIHGVALKALAHGATRVSPESTRLVWDLRRTPLPCEAPPRVPDLYSTEDPILVSLGVPQRKWWVELIVRCRKCPNCLRVRSWEWAARAKRECAMWPNTLFGTLTVKPEELARASAIASRRLVEEGIPLLHQTADQLFSEKVAVIGEWITLYIKRVRKALKTPARFLLVAEHHKSGEPHFHMLWHEVVRPTADQWDTYRVLVDQWQGNIINELPTGHGWAVWSGIDRTDPREARYVCKYLSKSLLGRVRPSQLYGQIEHPSSDPAKPHLPPRNPPC